MKWKEYLRFKNIQENIRKPFEFSDIDPWYISYKKILIIHILVKLIPILEFL